MTAPSDVAAHTLFALPWPTVAALRAALLRTAGADAPVQLQEAGYAGGEALFDAFRAWLANRGLGEPGALPLSRFAELATAFFEELGWGSIAIGSMHDALATVDATPWMESDDAPGDDAPACHVSTGLFADFFSRVAEVPLAVLEVECRTTGAERCRFLVGSVELLEAVYEALGRGEDYEEVAQAAAESGGAVESL